MIRSHKGRRTGAARPLGWAALALALATALPLAMSGCKPNTECAAEVMTGAGAYKGKASGPAGDVSVRRKATKDACTRMCLETKSVSLDTCAARCVVDAEAGKVGVKLKCSDDAAGNP